VGVAVGNYGQTARCVPGILPGNALSIHMMEDVSCEWYSSPPGPRFILSRMSAFQRTVWRIVAGQRPFPDDLPAHRSVLQSHPFGLNYAKNTTWKLNICLIEAVVWISGWNGIFDVIGTFYRDTG